MSTQHRKAIANGDTLQGLYPKGIDWNIPLEPLTLVEMFNRAVQNYDEKICLDYFGKEFSFRDMGELVDKAAKGFQKMGVKKGTRVGLYMPNTPWYPILFLGALKAGGIAVNYSLEHSERELREQAKLSGTDIFVTSDKPDFYKTVTNLLRDGTINQALAFNLADTLPDDRSRLPASMRWGLPVIKMLNRLTTLFNAGIRKKVTFIDNFMDNDAAPRPVEVLPEDTALLQFTTGSTGGAKAVELTHNNISANVRQLDESITRTPAKGMDNRYAVTPGAESMFVALPFSHIFPTTVGLFMLLHLGMKSILALNPRDLETNAAIIERTKPDTGIAVPAMVEKYDFKSLKTLIVGGKGIAEDAVQKATENSLMRIFRGYGLSETSPVVCFLNMFGPYRENSVGQPLPRIEVRVCDPGDPDRVLNIDEEGELQVRGPAVMKGYWNAPDANAQIMTGDGWLRTGDIGKLDDELFIYITGRNKRQIQPGGTGKKFAAEPIEDALNAHPAIAECAVIAVHKTTAREQAKVFIRVKEGHTLNEQTVRTYLEKDIGLPRRHTPYYYEFTSDPLPQAKGGKGVDWKKLENMEAAKEERAQMTTQNTRPKP